MTKYGKMIAEIVLSSCDHPTAEQIFLRMKEKNPHISMATIYNNLKTLTEDGVIRKITMADSPDRFDKPGHHEHLICARCGRLADVRMGDWTRQIEEEIGFPILSYDLKISYLCSACREKNEQD